MLNCNNNVSSWKGLLSKVANYEDTPMMTENDFPAGATGDVPVASHSDEDFLSWLKSKGKALGDKISQLPGKSTDIDPEVLDSMMDAQGVHLHKPHGTHITAADAQRVYHRIGNAISQLPGKSTDIDPDTVKAMAAEHGVYLDEPKLKASDFKIKPLAEGSKLGLGHAVAGAAASAGSAGVLMKILKKRKKKATVSKLRKILRAL